jgi:putative mycofactocin binding protein MftB
VRGERFGAIAYDNRSQRLVLINAREVVAVAALLRGNDRARDELAPLGLSHGRLEHLLDELVCQDLVEVCWVGNDALRVVNNGES